jgi:hypothetical protein
MVEKCPNCGNAIQPGNKFCKNCGYKVVNDTPYNVHNTQQVPSQPMPAQPMPYNTPSKHSGPGTASLVLGIISMCLIWLSFFPGVGFILFLIILFPMSLIGTILGGWAYWGRAKDKFGLAGFVLSLIVIIIGLVISLIFSFYFFGMMY